MRISSIYRTNIIFIIINLTLPLQAYATQEHKEPEGLFVHEIAHLFFIFTSVYIILRNTKSQKNRPLKYFQISFVFFLIWNIITLVTHLLREKIHPGVFKGPYLYATNIYHYLWYGGSIIEHIFLVLACYFFLKSLLSFKEELS